MDVSQKDSPKNGFPSDFLTPKEKDSKEYALKWCQSVDGRGNSAEDGFYTSPIKIGDKSIKRSQINRAYARAEQPVEKYKPILGFSDKKDRNDPLANLQLRVLAWENLGIMPKFINVLTGNLMTGDNSVAVRAIDKRAVIARKQKRWSLQQHVMNAAFYEQISAQTGIPFEGAVQEDVAPMPETMGEVDMYMDRFYKEDYCLAAQDMLKQVGEQNNYNQKLAGVIDDLLTVGWGATRVYRVQDTIRVRQCDTDRMVMSSTTKDACDDIKYIGEYWDLTIGQLKEIAGSQFTEDQYKEIAALAMGNANYWNGVNVSEYYSNNMCYPWDSTKITILDLTWFSPNYRTTQVDKNKYGNVGLMQKDESWYRKLEKKGVTKEVYNENNKGKSELIRYSMDDQYQACWIKGTKYVFNYGKSKDMIRSKSDAGKVIGPYTVYKVKKPLVELLIPVIDNIQINWLQYQHHAAKSRPSGMDIEFSALQDISVAGAGGAALKPKDVLQIYFETGILLWRRKDASGYNNNWRPIQELQNGLNPAFSQHFQACLNGVNLLRDIAGLNEMTDASTPNSEMGKAVATMAVAGTDDAIKSLRFAVDQINLGTNDKILRHVTGMAQTGMAPSYIEALGMEKLEVFKLLDDLSIHDLGCYLEKGPSEEEKQWINAYAQEGVKNGSLYPEEAMEVMTESNRYRKVQLLKMYREQKKREMARQSQMEQQQNAQVQIASAQSKAQSDAQLAQQDYMMELQKMQAQFQMEDMKGQRQLERDVFLARVQSAYSKGEALAEEDAKRVTALMVADRQGQWSLLAAHEKGKQNPRQPGSKSR